MDGTCHHNDRDIRLLAGRPRHPRFWRRFCRHRAAGLSGRRSVSARSRSASWRRPRCSARRCSRSAVGVVAPRYELRHLLIAGAVLMAATGVMLNVEDLLLIVVVAFIGTVNPSGGDVGMLVPLEQTDADARRDRPRPHAGVRALQPDRRHVDCGRRAQRGRARRARRLPASAGSPLSS